MPAMEGLIYRPNLTESSESPSVMRRVGSSPDMDPDIEQNKNISWVHGAPLILFYLAVTATIPLFSFLLDIPNALAWTLLNVLHTIGTFPFLHWIKGVPFSGVESDQGAYEALTWWEQLDSGAQFTKTKKILTLVPIILYATSLYVSDGFLFLLVNTIASVPIILAKMPFMHRVRILGINK
eukprot:CAMPEP_0184335742 /NCGR_PEP_ID=MMETSP1089-20130417/4260_1 /TAXON_ID=38269 ORGANISM="Gloeochaete wittrockiana, Strain SAG46.84" /NCGR_SAMPLE_ID=MMETSP1089 /ASSEMBLY_ACC=CAM_ASM_000445 /LENGTH=180 /DNA_ID=CAMNT_0026660559 /DNA_START=257 /DNA_END=799 /DNA_ORIENTATION=+